MNIFEGMIAGIFALGANKLRSLLTMLGIIIGVGSVLAMISVGDGAKAIVMEEANRFGGADQFSIYRSSRIRKGRNWVTNRSKEYFTYDDVLAIEAEAELALAAQDDLVLGYMAKLVALDAMALSEEAIDAELADSALPTNSSPHDAVNFFMKN